MEKIVEKLETLLLELMEMKQLDSMTQNLQGLLSVYDDLVATKAALERWEVEKELIASRKNLPPNFTGGPNS